MVQVLKEVHLKQVKQYPQYFTVTLKLPFYSILVTITNLYGSKVTTTGGLRVILEIQIESLSLEFESG